MAAKPGNSINQNSTSSGLFTWDGTSTASTTGLTQYYTLCGASSNTVQNIAPGTSGWVLTSGGGSAYPSYTALPFTKMPWTDETTNFSVVSQNGYFVTGAATATMPASPAQGDTVAFVVDGAVALTVTANTGQYLQIGAAKSASAGTAVNAASVTGCSVTFVYRSSDDVWFSTSCIGTFTVT